MKKQNQVSKNLTKPEKYRIKVRDVAFNNKGITLIALVITIIILIILAGVAINLTLGDNGIFTKTKYAKEQYQMSQVKRKIELAIADIQTDKISNNEECTIDTIISELPNKIPGLTIEKDGDGAKGTLDDYEYSIDKDFNVTIKGQDTTGGGNQGEGETPKETYNVTFNGTNITSDGASTVKNGETYTTTITPSEGYIWPAKVTVVMGEKTLTVGTEYTYENGIITISNVTGNIQITANGEKIGVTVANYGEYVDYGIDLNEDGDTTNDWQIFYKEEDETSPNYGNTYIIAANYLDLTKRNHLEVITNAGMVAGNNTTYDARWNRVPAYDTKMDTDTNIRKRYMFSWNKNTTNDNIKCVSKLLNTDIWDSFVTDKLQEKGGTAIGGPTAEMWVASWNKAYPTSTKLTLNTNNTNGYEINENDSISLGNTQGYTDAPNVYFPDKTNKKAAMYWLACPSSYDTIDLISVFSYGDVDNWCCKLYNSGLRPLVSLPSVVSLTPSETDNLWNINY